MNSFLPDGERHQASLGGAPKSVPTWILSSLRGATAQIVTVKSVDYLNSTVSVFNSNGPAVARVLKSKASGKVAGHAEMPNVNDIGVVLPVNGDSKSVIWVGGLSSVEVPNTLEHDENFVSDADLVHRVYDKHESGSYSILDRLGKFFSRFKKKASSETDAATKNLDISLSNEGVLRVVHYRGEDKASYEFTSDQAGSLAITLYKDDGTTPAMKLASDKDGNVTQDNAQDLAITTLGGVTNEITGALALNTGGDAKINGGEELAFKSALETLKSQFDALVSDYNAHKLIYNLHTHVCSLPGIISAVPVAVDPIPVVSTPITPTGTTKTSAG